MIRKIFSVHYLHQCLKIKVNGYSQRQQIYRMKWYKILNTYLCNLSVQSAAVYGSMNAAFVSFSSGRKHAIASEGKVLCFSHWYFPQDFRSWSKVKDWAIICFELFYASSNLTLCIAVELFISFTVANKKSAFSSDVCQLQKMFRSRIF